MPVWVLRGRFFILGRAQQVVGFLTSSFAI